MQPNSGHFGHIALLALPGSGKSEVRTFLQTLSPDVAREDLHLAPDRVELDDFPHVWTMRLVDDALAEMRQPRVFFQAPHLPFRDAQFWSVLMHLLNSDWYAVQNRVELDLDRDEAADGLMTRFDIALQHAGLPPYLTTLPMDVRRKLRHALTDRAVEMLVALNRTVREAHTDGGLSQKTVVLEFSRGGPMGASMPLAAPQGYRHALSLLHPAVLEDLAILYVWVTPEDAWAKNEARAKPGAEGTTLNHMVPREVMRLDYGCDDIAHLLGESGRNGNPPETIAIPLHGRTVHVPCVVLDNRGDITSFARKPRNEWKATEVGTLHQALRESMERLWTVRQSLDRAAA